MPDAWQRALDMLTPRGRHALSSALADLEDAGDQSLVRAIENQLEAKRRIVAERNVWLVTRRDSVANIDVVVAELSSSVASSGRVASLVEVLLARRAELERLLDADPGTQAERKIVELESALAGVRRRARAASEVRHELSGGKL